MLLGDSFDPNTSLVLNATTFNIQELIFLKVQCLGLSGIELKTPKAVSGASVWVLHSGLLYKHGVAAWQTLWKRTHSIRRYKRLVLR